MARATTDREDIRGLNIMEYIDTSDIGALRQNMIKLEYAEEKDTIIFTNADDTNFVTFKFTDHGIDVDVEGEVLSGAKIFLNLITELQNEYMLVKKR